MASGEMTMEEFTQFLRVSVALIAGNIVPGAISFICMDWRHMGELLSAAATAELELKQLCVWVKTNAGMGSFYRSQHELIFVFKKPGGEHINNFGLGGRGRLRSNVWTYAGANGFSAARAKNLDTHPTVKPLQMVMDAIMDCSRRGHLVLDPFAGSGTTLVAAARTGRVGCGIEIDPGYVDAAVKRLQKETKLTARLEGDASFEEVRANRSRGNDND